MSGAAGSRGISSDQLDWWFKYHPPADHPSGPEAAAERYARIRDAGKAFAKVILENTPASADQTAAVRKVREAVFTANAAIACEGR